MSVSIHRAQLRELLFSVLRTDSDFVAFVLDYFPEVQQKFSSGMDRTSKVNLLLESEDSDEILKALHRAHPEIAARLGHKHVLPAAPSPSSFDPTAMPTASDASSPPITQDEPPQYVLHLSDLHFAESTQAAQWHTQLMLDLRNQMQVESLAGIVLSGDITNHATDDQFGYAQRFLERVCKTFAVPPGRLLVVPGNHDVNWNLTDSGQNGFPPYASFHQTITGAEYPLDPATQATVMHWPEPNLVLVGFNSAWKTDRANPARAGLHAEAFGDALAHVLDHRIYRACTKLAVWHHPPSELTTEAGLDGALLQQLAQAGFQLVLHGHIHRADNALFRYYRQSPMGGLEILTAGTFGAPTKELVKGYPFQYQVLAFCGGDLTVHTRKREDVAGGWVADHRWQQGPGQSPLSYYQITLSSRLKRPDSGSKRHRENGTPPLPASPIVAEAVAKTADQSAHAAKVFGDGAPIQWVDRDDQNRELRKLWPSREHRLLFLPGAQEEAHGMFLWRVDRLLPHSSARQIIHVIWPSRDSPELPEFPTTENGLLHALATSLGGNRLEDLAARLAYHLHLHDLLVIHPKVSRRFAEDALLEQYYTRSIPKQLAGLRSTHRCKFIQPVSWRDLSSPLTKAGMWITRQKQPKVEAYQMMHNIETHAQKEVLPVTILHELSPIQYDHVIAFLRRCKYKEALPPKERDQKRDALAKEIMSGKATSEMILNRLSKELADVEVEEDDDE
jgi:predicted phosphodiesterase